MDRVVVLGVPVDPVTVDDLHAHIRGFVRADARASILHANVHAINLACRHAWLARVFEQADLVFCDGAGVQLGARILGQRLPERITYADWLWRLAAWCASEHLSLFLLGARPGVAAQAADRLRERCPGVTIAGTHHGYFDKTPGSAESLAVVQHLNAARPHIVIVGFGMPAQERWVHHHRLAINAPVILTGGAAFDYVSGHLRRAPAWMTRHGLEWLGRMLIEPGRLTGRYLLGNPLFLMRVLRARMRRGANAPPRR